MTITVLNPATLKTVDVVKNNDISDATKAVDAAAAAFKSWKKTPPRRRSEILHRAYELMIRDRAELAELITRENGKSLSDATGEVTYAAEFFRWFAEEAVRPGGDFGESPAGGTRTLVTHRPVGVAALVTPWNFPAAMITRKIGPALAAGCTTVVKPAVETPLTALAIEKLLTEAGLPDGVVTVVPTTDSVGVVGAWLDDPRVRKISFTGSTPVGRVLLRHAADRVVNSSMELGGNAPFVVADDADLDAAVAGAMIAKFRNGGQACTAANRFYVHVDVVGEFVARFGAEVEKLTVGPAADGAAIGPLISEAALKRVTASVDEAVAAGARISHRAPVPEAAGWFYPPTVLVDVPSDAPILAEEIFGPVAAITTWSTDEELLELVNESEYGLAAYVFSGDLLRALRLGEAIDAGMVGVNRGLVSDPSAPFGGVKQSGLGREGAREGLREFQETQYLSVDWP
ncbi:NAD-dependent succinate-semialdehyde dehydrogenase [Actinoplanes couchii]|uniref:NAD-dependent succinate-semialdehyde dehydrogenase n=1 Tax=Actinoplanes couchii TaxID=403638 RepID=A0ABQ3X795_9ACTN|nr:NAD-dependent succinate-semialdehyde dehydrogenase [Actinoplanes couchii]MDR6322211.1 succinate-semialdehyde dehydrogenase/glutarate-semialdehyde dehydrogenase [Actinoplanes couchii]GID54373.1 NAD-dependent succinate-semialdehyde dehydrogenase [Actinoplanes couchii]